MANIICISQIFRDKNWQREGIFATTVGQSKVRHPAGTCCAHLLQEVLTSPAVEPEQQFIEITLCVGR